MSTCCSPYLLTKGTISLPHFHHQFLPQRSRKPFQLSLSAGLPLTAHTTILLCKPNASGKWRGSPLFWKAIKTMRKITNWKYCLENWGPIYQLYHKGYPAHLNQIGSYSERLYLTIKFAAVFYLSLNSSLLSAISGKPDKNKMDWDNYAVAPVPSSQETSISWMDTNVHTAGQHPLPVEAYHLSCTKNRTSGSKHATVYPYLHTAKSREGWDAGILPGKG